MTYMCGGMRMVEINRNTCRLQYSKTLTTHGQVSAYAQCMHHICIDQPFRYSSL